MQQKMTAENAVGLGSSTGINTASMEIKKSLESVLWREAAKRFSESQHINRASQRLKGTTHAMHKKSSSDNGIFDNKKLLTTTGLLFIKQ